MSTDYQKSIENKCMQYSIWLAAIELHIIEIIANGSSIEMDKLAKHYHDGYLSLIKMTNLANTGVSYYDFVTDPEKFNFTKKY